MVGQSSTKFRKYYITVRHFLKIPNTVHIKQDIRTVAIHTTNSSNNSKNTGLWMCTLSRSKTDAVINICRIVLE